MTYAQELKSRILAKDSSTSPVRAVIYARTATNNVSQKEPCVNQLLHAEEFINQHPNILLVGIYTDEGLSGASIYNRPAYCRMLDLIRQGRAELVITKDLSRLNRGQNNTLSLINLLITHYATVYTLTDCKLHDFEDFNSSLSSTRIQEILSIVFRTNANKEITHDIRTRT